MLDLAKESYIKSQRFLLGGYALPPINLTFELTYRCNLDCRICYLKSTGAENYINQNKELTFGEIKEVLETLAFKIPFSRKKLPHVLFTGGEIFLRKDIMDILIFASQKASVSILTNGMLLSDSIIKALIDLNLETVIFSIDGPREIHDRARNKQGAFNETMANIEKTARLKKVEKKQRPFIQINTLISEVNAGILPELIPISEDINADELVFVSEDLSSCRWLGAAGVKGEECLKTSPRITFDKPDSLKKSLDRIDREIVKKGTRIRFVPYGTSRGTIKHYLNDVDVQDYVCYYPWTTMRISAYGDIFPCYRLKIGNLREDGLREIKNIWNSEAYRRFRRTLAREGPFAGCVGCSRLTRR